MDIEIQLATAEIQEIQAISTTPDTDYDRQFSEELMELDDPLFNDAPLSPSIESIKMETEHSIATKRSSEEEYSFP
jgi:hypothetical protein